MAHTSSKTSVSNLFSLRILEKERLQSDTRVPDTLNRYPPISPYKTRFAPFFAKKVFGGNLCNFFGKRNFEKWLVLDLFFSLWTPQAGRATRQCPHDATSGGKEATDCRCRHHGESESSGRSSNNPWHHRFRTPKLVAAHGERSRRKPFRKFWPNHRAWDPPSAKPPPQTL
jgi:hypothetical protein